MEDFHSFPQLGHNHQTTSALPGINKSGVNFPFFVGCHSYENSGYRYNKDFSKTNVLYSKILFLSLLTFTEGIESE